MTRKKQETRCADCAAVLEKDEIALSLKLFGKETQTLYCLNCTAGIVDCEVADLSIKIEEFKEQGCTLFL